MDRAPELLVILPVFNGEQVIERTIESILVQTFTDWKLVIVDDASTDNTLLLIERFARQDERINIISNEMNIGLPASINKAIAAFNCQFVARADADDFNYPERFQMQLDYLKTHSDIDVCGTGAYLLSKTGKRIKQVTMPATHKELCESGLFGRYFFHSSVLFRKRFFERTGYYDVALRRVQDVDLWVRGIKAGCKFVNLPEPLIDYATNDYQRSWGSIYQSLCSLFLIAEKHQIKNRYISISGFALKLIMTKLGLYRPRSLKVHELSD